MAAELFGDQNGHEWSERIVSKTEDESVQIKVHRRCHFRKYKHAGRHDKNTDNGGNPDALDFVAEPAEEKPFAELGDSDGTERSGSGNFFNAAVYRIGHLMNEGTHEDHRLYTEE